jgi:hypothetical protein
MRLALRKPFVEHFHVFVEIVVSERSPLKGRRPRADDALQTRNLVNP